MAAESIVLPQRALQPTRKFYQRCVSNLMAHGVVDPLGAIDVNHNHPDAFSGSRPLGKCFLKDRHNAAPPLQNCYARVHPRFVYRATSGEPSSMTARFEISALPTQRIAGCDIDKMDPGTSRTCDGLEASPFASLLLLQMRLHVHARVRASEDNKLGHVQGWPEGTS